MKIVHICSTDLSGGAAKAAFGINKALNENGMDSYMLVQKKIGNNDRVIQFSNSLLGKTKYYFRFLLDYLYISNLTIQERGRFSFPYWGVDITKHIQVNDADILHLHWINEGFFSLETFQKLIAFNKPIVWTFHDMWAFTGGCHYSLGCEKFETECKNCPSLKNSSSNDYSYKIFNMKMEIFKQLNINLVTCSNWLSKEVVKSKIFNNKQVTVIPNTIDIDVFKPFNKDEARKNLKLPIDKKLILFGTMTLKDERKGFKYLIEGLKILYQNYPNIREEIEIVMFGSSKNLTKVEIPFKTNFLGRINSSNNLAKIYSSADIFIAPSIQDNLPNTVMESLSCGTPVVAFNIGGMADMITHLKNGYLAIPFSIEDLVKGIDWTISQIKGNIELQKNARNKVVEYYNAEVISSMYKDLYKKLLIQKSLS